MHAAIHACKMYIQRGRDPIDKLVVGSVVPFDSRNQTVAKVQNNRVVGRNAGSYGKLDDSIGAVIVSKLIESGRRWMTVAIALACFVASLLALPLVPRQFFPATDDPKKVYQDEVCRIAIRRTRFFAASG